MEERIEQKLRLHDYKFENDLEVKQVIDYFLLKSGECDVSKIPLALSETAPTQLANFILVLCRSRDLRIFLQRNYRPIDLLRLSLNIYLRNTQPQIVTRLIYVLSHLPNTGLERSFMDYTLYVLDPDPLLTIQFHSDLSLRLQEFNPFTDEVLQTEIQELVPDERDLSIVQLSPSLGGFPSEVKKAPLKWICPIHNCEIHDLYISYYSTTDTLIAQALAENISSWKKFIPEKKDTETKDMKSNNFIKPFCLHTCCADLDLDKKNEIMKREIKYTPMIVLLLTDAGLTSIEDVKDNLFLEYELIWKIYQKSRINIIRFYYPQGYTHRSNVWIPALQDLLKKMEIFQEIYFQTNFECIQEEIQKAIQLWDTTLSRRELFPWLATENVNIDGRRLRISEPTRVIGDILWDRGQPYFEIEIDKLSSSKNITIGVISSFDDKSIEYGYQIDTGKKFQNNQFEEYDTSISKEWKGTIGVWIDFKIGTIEFLRDGKLLGIAHLGVKGPLRPFVYSETKGTQFILQRSKALPSPPKDFTELHSLKAETEKNHRSRFGEDNLLTLFNHVTMEFALKLEEKPSEDELVVRTSILEEIEMKLAAKKYSEVCGDLNKLAEELKILIPDLDAKEKQVGPDSKLSPGARTDLEEKIKGLNKEIPLKVRQKNQLILQKTVLIFLDRLYRSLLLALSMKSFGKRISGLLQKIPSLFQSLLDIQFNLCVVGVLKAGKSTVGDALVGKNFLPTGGLACTALPIRLHHVADLKNPTLHLPMWEKLNILAIRVREHLLETKTYPQEQALKELSEKLIQKEPESFLPKYEGLEAIQQALMYANYLERLALILNFEIKGENNKLPCICQQIKKLEDTPLVDTQFRSLGNRRLLGELILVDTPGSLEVNFASTFDPMVKLLIEKCDTSLCVVSAGNVQMEGHFQILETVAESSLKQSQNYFVLLNRKDELNAQNLQDASNEIKKRALNNPSIIPCSAKLALVAWQVERYLDEHKKLPLLSKNSPTWLSDFAKYGWGMTGAALKMAKASEAILRATTKAILQESGLNLVLEQFASKTADIISENRSRKLLTNILRIVDDGYKITSSSITREGAGREGLRALGECLIIIKQSVKYALLNLQTDGQQLLNNLKNTIEQELDKVAEEVISELPEWKDRVFSSVPKAQNWLTKRLKESEEKIQSRLARKFDRTALTIKKEAEKLQTLFTKAQLTLVGDLKSVRNEKGTQLDQKLYFQDLLSLGLGEVTEDYNYQINKSENFSAFVTDKTRLVQGKRVEWWTFFYFQVKFKEARITGKEVKEKLDSLVKEACQEYSTTLMNGVHAIWKSQVCVFEEKLHRNITDIERDLLSALNKTGGKDDRIHGLQILAEQLTFIEKEARHLLKELEKNSAESVQKTSATT